MRSAEASTAYLEHCLAAFMNALRESAMLSKVNDAFELAETLHFAADLLDIITDELEPRQAHAAGADVTSRYSGSRCV